VTPGAPRILVSCEHGGNRIPAAFRRYFRGRRAQALLASHRGHDPGALVLARDLARACAAPLFYSTVTRLLIELNRSPRHPRLYSEITGALPAPVRSRLLARYYWPYRTTLEAGIDAAVRSGHRVIHISAHSFTPVLNGRQRHADVGFLYDPRRKPETRFCRAWQQALRGGDPALIVRRNYPYRGVSDGLTTHLRRRFTADCYIGVELEVNQKHALGNPRAWRRLRRLLSSSLQSAIESEKATRRVMTAS